MGMKKTVPVTETGDAEPASSSENVACLCAPGTCHDLAGLIVLVERSLESADALGLPFVGLDLCSALEKLNELKESQYPTETMPSGK